MREPRGVEAAGRLRRLNGPRVRPPVLSGGGWVPPATEGSEGDEASALLPLDPLPAQLLPLDPLPAGQEGSPSGPGPESPVPPPVSRGRVRVRRIPLGMPGRAAVLALALALAVAAGVGARALLSDAGRPVPSGGSLQRASSGGGTSVPGATPSGRAVVAAVGPVGSGTAGTVVVDVVGKVRRPGIVRLPVGSRVADAVAAAGGVLGGAAVERVNLARRLVDGEQVLIPGPRDVLAPADAAADGAAGGAPGTAGGAGAPVDLNSATVAQLDALPGVGPVTAQRIVAWRTQHQRFSRVEELGEVDGIGPKLLQRLTPLVRV